LEEAVIRTLEAHESGLALLLVTHKERAELYVDQFGTFSITLTIEPDEA
jgi:ATP-dependent Clp protease adapter protein ClpS